MYILPFCGLLVVQLMVWSHIGHACEIIKQEATTIREQWQGKSNDIISELYRMTITVSDWHSVQGTISATSVSEPIIYLKRTYSSKVLVNCGWAGNQQITQQHRTWNHLFQWWNEQWTLHEMYPGPAVFWPSNIRVQLPKMYTKQIYSTVYC